MAPEPAATVREGRDPASFRHRWGPACLSAVVIACIGAEVHSRDRQDRSDAAPRHERIRMLAQSAIPRSVDEWVGHDVAATPAAVSLLRPNVLINRTFENIRTRESVSICFVQCSDARDLLGHFPPICYRGNGMVIERAETRDWQVGQSRITGMRYRFRAAEPESVARTVVDNFMVLPIDGFARDMESVARVAQDPERRHLGAAEMQVVSDGSMSDERRDEVFRTFVAPAMSLLVCVGAEAKHD